ncbi:MAG: hypothetical protein EB003_02195, partial [Flavobacteriia bacterium]|nr:hypothetical protein [Flavobacteriia bacterium]
HDTFFNFMKPAIDDWEPVGQQSIKIEIVTETGGKVEMLKNRGAVSPLKKPQILNQTFPDEPCNLTSAIKVG